AVKAMQDAATALNRDMARTAKNYRFDVTTSTAPIAGSLPIFVTWSTSLPGGAAGSARWVLGADRRPTEGWVQLNSNLFRTDAPWQRGETAADHAARNQNTADSFTSNLGHEAYGHVGIGLKDRTAADNGLMSYGGDVQQIDACTNRDVNAALGIPD
ncbi:MAG: hypothetical protein JWL73_3095, partial [Actinomycetia bacterium]|nr:hypothetical protein [Actinomycetes bacterium]